MNTITLRNWPAARQWIQVVSTAVLAALVSYNWLGNSQAELIATFITAVLPPALSIFNSASGIRTWLYSLITGGQTLIVGLNVFTTLQVSPIANILLAAIGTGVAVTHTPTPGGVQGPVTASIAPR
ncbi:phage holin [Mycolicibacterium canariasense]|uniref:phage holin n=2 Tax=Mycolicibacterium canariasense TaxID=228230 RepID=UPI000A14F114|nr:hypothetical protein [Mycolicibacterium canariasense]MCV7208427.1 hypothetical protein [Mycolicibacterium canariasense]ORU95428.1 hypothetical protein AWB94_31505 [Mycolicibacterium canariasense]